jgi:folate-binding protein YgfZ
MMRTEPHAPVAPLFARRTDLVFLRAAGADRIDLLHRLSTNDLLRLAPGAGTTTVLTTDKGRIVEWVAVYALEDSLLLAASAQNAEAVLAWLDRYTIMEDFHLARAHLAVFDVFGTALPAVLADAGARPLHHHHQITLAGVRAHVARALPIGGAAARLWCEAADAGTLTASLAELGAVEISLDAYDARRIEAGFPASGRELTRAHNPLEAGLECAVSFTKGCYIGQEVIARLNTYKKVQRHLVRVVGIATDPMPALPAEVVIDGADVGTLTSAADLPDGRRVGLAYVRSAACEAGRRLEVGDSSARADMKLVELVEVPA